MQVALRRAVRARHPVDPLAGRALDAGVVLGEAVAVLGGHHEVFILAALAEAAQLAGSGSNLVGLKVLGSPQYIARNLVMSCCVHSPHGLGAQKCPPLAPLHLAGGVSIQRPRGIEADYALQCREPRTS